MNTLTAGLARQAEKPQYLGGGPYEVRSAFRKVRPAFRSPDSAATGHPRGR